MTSSVLSIPGPGSSPSNRPRVRKPSFSSGTSGVGMAVPPRGRDTRTNVTARGMFPGPRGGGEHRRMELQIGDVAIVSGAASGIGRALAEGLGRRGVHVVLTDRDADAVHAARDALAATGASASAEALDVTDRDAVARGVAGTEDRCGRVDLVAATAGVPGHPARL